MTKYLTKINEKEYLKKMNDEVIDWTVQIDTDEIFIINKFLNKKRKSTAYYLKYRTAATTKNIYAYNNRHYYMVYDRIDNFRLPVPKGGRIKSIRCPFTSPYTDFKDVKEVIKKPWINQDYTIYLVNPRLYRYCMKGPLTLAHVRNLDDRYFKGMTDHCVNNINELMIEETGEPLFYLI